MSRPDELSELLRLREMASFARFAGTFDRESIDLYVKTWVLPKIDNLIARQRAKLAKSRAGKCTTD